MIEDFEDYINDLMIKLRKTTLTDKQKSIMSAGFCDPIMLADYFEHYMNYADDDPKFSKRMLGMLLWADILINVDKLTDDELFEARKALSHGFVQMSGNRKIKAMLTRIHEGEESI